MGLGYCCINNTLRQKGVFTGRTVRKDRFLREGLSVCATLGEQNLRDLLTILEWNVQHDVSVFRIGSGILPWGESYHIEDLPNFDVLCDLGQRVGEYVVQHGMRVSFHPDHFVKLASSKSDVVDASIATLKYHDDLYALFGLPATYYYPLNIHVGQTFSEDAVSRFIAAFDRLPRSVQQRLVVENDDKLTQFSVKQLFDTLFRERKIPITFDAFHHQFHPDGYSLETAFYAAAHTWGNVKPLFHYSESKTTEGWSGNPRAHADYVQDFSFMLFHDKVDWDVEAKAKELALAPILPTIITEVIP